MRVLVLTSAGRLPDFSNFYAALGLLVEIDTLVLDKDMQRNLQKTLQGVNLSSFHRVFLDLHFKNIYRQGNFLSQIQGLLIYEEDACQNYIPNSRWYKCFSRLYQQIPQAKIIVTSALTASRLQTEGYNVFFYPKVYDPSRIFLEPRRRDIELAFIGRMASAAYSGRRALLEQLALLEPLQLLRTEPGDAYRHALNRIHFFVSADIGLSEYMAKSFEAMACGCVVLAYHQEMEESAIGLEEGKHLLLYKNLDELRQHLRSLRENPEFAQRIADQGRSFVAEKLTYPHLAIFVANALAKTWLIATPPVTGWRNLVQRVKHLLIRP